MKTLIHYAKTSDHVNVAYATFGEGQPIILLPMLPFSHIEKQAELPVLSARPSASEAEGHGGAIR